MDAWLFNLFVLIRVNSWLNETYGGDMKSYRKELWFEVPTRRAFINITPQVNECLRESGIREGLVLCNAMHITASVLSN